MKKILFLLVLLFLNNCNKQIPLQEKFHSPYTSVEKSLDTILHLNNERSKGFLENTKEFLSKELIISFEKAEIDAINENCQGKDRAGELCGLDFSPLYCTQDTNDTYLYKTIEKTSNSAIIEYTWPQKEKAVATYRLIKVSDNWIIDGIKCNASSYFFNFIENERF